MKTETKTLCFYHQLIVFVAGRRLVAKRTVVRSCLSVDCRPVSMNSSYEKASANMAKSAASLLFCCINLHKFCLHYISSRKFECLIPVLMYNRSVWSCNRQLIISLQSRNIHEHTNSVWWSYSSCNMDITWYDSKTSNKSFKSKTRIYRLTQSDMKQVVGSCPEFTKPICVITNPCGSSFTDNLPY